MIDYRTHFVLHAEFLARMQHPLPGDGERIRDTWQTAAEDRPDIALLGCLVDHLVAHANDDFELNCLREAATLWHAGLKLWDELTSLRGHLEHALTNPAAAESVDEFNNAANALPVLRKDFRRIADGLFNLRTTLLTIPYLRPHPRQQGLPVEEWGYADRFLSRATHRLLNDIPEGSLEVAAFKAGVLSSYLGNMFGSAYLGRTVGGPRRLHRYRDRVARNTLGTHYFIESGVMSLSEAAERLSFGAATPDDIAIPTDVHNALSAGLNSAFPAMPASADLDEGLRRLVESLQLLDSFTVPDLPTPIALPLLQTTAVDEYAANPATAGGTLHTNGLGSGPPQAGSASGMNNVTNADTPPAITPGCNWAIWAFIWGLQYLPACIALLDEGKDCTPQSVHDKWAQWFNPKNGDPEEEPVPVIGVSGQFLTEASTNGFAAHLAQELLGIQITLWQLFDTCQNFLVGIGLIYPTADHLESIAYSQFLSAPADPNWPRLSDPYPITTYMTYPSGYTEKPQPAPNGAYISSADRLRAGFAEMAAQHLDDFEVHPTNMDLDADRGLKHQCWTVPEPIQISDQPVPVTILGFNEL